MKSLTPYTTVAGELPRMVEKNIPLVLVSWTEMLELKDEIIKILTDKINSQYENELKLDEMLKGIGLK